MYGRNRINEVSRADKQTPDIPTTPLRSRKQTRLYLFKHVADSFCRLVALLLLHRVIGGGRARVRQRHAQGLRHIHAKEEGVGVTKCLEVLAAPACDIAGSSKQAQKKRRVDILKSLEQISLHAWNPCPLRRHLHGKRIDEM